MSEKRHFEQLSVSANAYHTAISRRVAWREYKKHFPRVTGWSLELLPLAPSSPRMGKSSLSRHPLAIKSIVRPVVVNNQPVAWLQGVWSSPKSRNAARRSGSRLVVLVAEHLSAIATECLLTAASPFEPTAVRAAREFVRRHLAEPCSTRDMARRVHLSEKYFCKLFRKWTGMTFLGFVALARIEKAKQLLADRSKQIKEVMWKAGFRSRPQFNRQFKRYTGANPTTWRNSLKTVAPRAEQFNRAQISQRDANIGNTMANP